MPNILDIRDSYRATLAFLPTRAELPVLLNERGLYGCGVEIGVKEGEYSELLLTYWGGQHLVSVDPWRAADASDYVDIANVPQETHEVFLARARERLTRFGARSTIWRMTSMEAAGCIPHHSLDFVYIDARHDFTAVTEDLNAWFDKVRPGGIVAGHDYLDGHFAAGMFGVKSAVDTFFGELGIVVYPSLLDGPFLSWFVEVPPPPPSTEFPTVA